MPDIHIDGKRYSVSADDNLLQACLSLGLDLPYFCWHPALGSVGACRQCAVIQYQNSEDDQGRIVMACMTPVAEGMRVSLENPTARAFRAQIIELLMSNHPHDCPVCEEGGECHLQDMTVMTGHTFRRYRGKKRTHRNQYLGPFINHEMNRCIACYRCVRFYRDYCGSRDLEVFAAHNHVYFGRHEDGILESEFSGNLVEVCPTGVFTDKTFSRHYTRKWDLQSAPSVCVHCGLGCNTSPGERYGSLRRIVNRYHGEINGYFLCDRGRFGYGFVNAASRIRQVTTKEGETLDEDSGWRRLQSLLAEAQGVIGIGSPRASLEANFALREAVGARHFHGGIADSEFACLRTVLEILETQPVRIASLREMERADAVLVLGEDVGNTAPRLALALRQAVRNRAFAIADRLQIPRWQDAAVREAAQREKTPLFCLGFAPTRLDDIATCSYRASPEELATFAFAVAHRIDPVAPTAEDLPSQLEGLAEEIATTLAAAKRPLIVSGVGAHSEILLKAAGQIARALSTRRAGRPTEVHFPVPECNSLGLALLEAGSLAAAFEAVELGLADTVIVLENDLYRRAQADLVDRFLERARNVIVIDHTLHETAKRADLVLPAATFAESEGTLVNSEGRAQRFFAVFEPTGGIQASWRWLGAGRWNHIDELTRAVADSVPSLRNIPQAAPGADFRIAEERIPRQPHRYSGRTAMVAHVHIHEPKPKVDEESPLAYSMEGAPLAPPAALLPFVWAPQWNSNQAIFKFQEEVNGPLAGGDPGVRLLEPGGSSGTWFSPPRFGEESRPGLRLVPLHHVFGSEEMSMFSPPIRERAPAPYLALHPEDAARFQLAAGDLVELGAHLRLTVCIVPRLAPGLAGIPVGLPSVSFAEVSSRYWLPKRGSAS
ncbi:MAG TPA: NADH-quinone oxidoreductase subunit NuoG [Methylococcus sp.]|nr:NADH-quinone oxidoreductase subunit NuoG [Methylococcus sp.]